MLPFIKTELIDQLFALHEECLTLNPSIFYLEKSRGDGRIFQWKLVYPLPVRVGNSYNLVDQIVQKDLEKN